MNKLPFAIALFLLGTAPAHATGGFVCRTAGSRPVEVSLGFGHVPGSPLILTRLTDNGRPVPVKARSGGSTNPSFDWFSSVPMQCARSS